MKTLKYIAPLVIAAPVLLAFTAPEDEVAFKPEADSAGTKNLSIELEFKIEDLYLNMGGQEVTPEMTGLDTEEPFTVDMLIEATDTYIKSAKNKPLILRRTFDSLSMEVAGQGESEDVEDFAQIEGETVEFKWNEEDGEYEIAYLESEGDEALLEELLVDMDLIALLPDGKVSEGDTWEVAADDLIPIFMPGGIAANTDEAGDEAEQFEEMITGQLEEAVKDFKVTCTYKGTKEVGEVSVGEITFAYKGDSSIDLSALIMEIAEMAGDQGPEIEDAAADIELSLQGEGTLLWNMAEGRMHEYNMENEIGIVIDVEVAASMQGQAFDVTVNAEFSGNGKWAMKAE